MKLVKINNNNFHYEVIDSEKPVLIFFYTEWSGACQILNLLIEKALQNYRNKIKFVQINIEQQKAIAKKYRVNKVPTLMFFKNGEAQNTLSGLTSQSELNRRIEVLLK